MYSFIEVNILNNTTQWSNRVKNSEEQNIFITVQPYHKNIFKTIFFV